MLAPPSPAAASAAGNKHPGKSVAAARAGLSAPGSLASAAAWPFAAATLAGAGPPRAAAPPPAGSGAAGAVRKPRMLRCPLPARFVRGGCCPGRQGLTPRCAAARASPGGAAALPPFAWLMNGAEGCDASGGSTLLPPPQDTASLSCESGALAAEHAVRGQDWAAAADAAAPALAAALPFAVPLATAVAAVSQERSVLCVPAHGHPLSAHIVTRLAPQAAAAAASYPKRRR